MKASENLISVNILGRTYKVKCPPEQAHELQQSAEYLNQHMQRLQQTKSMKTPDSVAVVAALNICHELLSLKNQKNQYIDNMHDKIHSLQKRIENFLETEEELLV